MMSDGSASLYDGDSNMDLYQTELDNNLNGDYGEGDDVIKNIYDDDRDIFSEVMDNMLGVGKDIL